MPDHVELLPAQRAVFQRVSKFTVQPPPRRAATLVDLYLAFGGALLRGWPEGAPAGFERVLKAARLYMTVRWLGDDPDFTRSAGASGHWMQLHRIVNELEQV